MATGGMCFLYHNSCQCNRDDNSYFLIFIEPGHSNSLLVDLFKVTTGAYGFGIGRVVTIINNHKQSYSLVCLLCFVYVFLFIYQFWGLVVARGQLTPRNVLQVHWIVKLVFMHCPMMLLVQGSLVVKLTRRSKCGNKMKMPLQKLILSTSSPLKISDGSSDSSIYPLLLLGLVTIMDSTSIHISYLERLVRIDNHQEKRRAGSDCSFLTCTNVSWF